MKVKWSVGLADRQEIGMDGIGILIAIGLVLILLGAAAAAFGADTRETFEDVRTPPARPNI